MDVSGREQGSWRISQRDAAYTLTHTIPTKAWHAGDEELPVWFPLKRYPFTHTETTPYVGSMHGKTEASSSF